MSLACRDLGVLLLDQVQTTHSRFACFAQTTRMDFVEHRTEPRERLALPLKLGAGAHGLTRDISPSGLYFEIRGDHDLSGTLFFEMDLAEAKVKFTAEGRIVRIEHREGCTGIAVKLLSPRLEPLP